MPDIMKMGKNPNYLGSWDLDDVPGHELTLTIEKIKDEEVVTNGKGENCTVCHWTDKAYKPMILNVTNKKTLCRLYKTKDTEQLKGKSVIIGIDKVKAFGDIHDALRIRNRMPAKTTAPAQKCEECGKDIAASNGMTSKQVADYTKKKYGKCLCAVCATAAASKAVQE
jgi:hypothetical protein